MGIGVIGWGVDIIAGKGEETGGAEKILAGLLAGEGIGVDTAFGPIQLRRDRIVKIVIKK